MSPDSAIALSVGPTTGPSFGFDRLVVKKAFFEEAERAPRAPNEPRPSTIDANVNIGAAIKIGTVDDRTWGDVTLTVIVLPDPKWQPYKIEVQVSGRFRLLAGGLDDFDKFCKLVAPSILFPYARQIINMLTADAADGPVRVQPLNIIEILAETWSKPTMVEVPGGDAAPEAR